MRLHEMPPEMILDEIEQRSDRLMEAEEQAGRLEADLKAWEAATAIAYRDSGKSMAEAEGRVRANAEWAGLYAQLQRANALAAKLKRDYQRAVIASDLYRTELATMRNVR